MAHWSNALMVAMSGGVDSSVAAALLVEQGHDVVGATLKLWGGPSDSGCCSVADVDDARRVAQQLGIEHHVFNLSQEFDRHVVTPYVEAHGQGRTPNPCIECNRSIKFDRLLERSDRLGFDRLATGHHARVTRDDPFRLRRGADTAKDQSYVLSMLGQDQLRRVVFPVGEMTKFDVRAARGPLGLRTAGKPDSQDVCFIGRVEGRQGFLGGRMAFHPGKVVNAAGEAVGTVDAVELVTVGQRRGMGHGSDGARRYVVAVDVPARRVDGRERRRGDGVRSVTLPRHRHVGGPTAPPGRSGRGPGERPRAARGLHGGRSRRRARRAVRRARSAPWRRGSRWPCTTIADPDAVVGAGIAA